jgi:diguanylate cyclase (GGDEF)-like protein
MDHKMLAEELVALRTVFDLVREPAFVVDARCGNIVNANPAACEALALARNQLIGRSWDDTGADFPHIARRTVDDNGRRFVVVVVHLSVSGRDEGCSVPRDALTGLANREALLARVSWDQNSDLYSRLGLLFVDLDGFKQVNDTWGHIVGDRVLRVVAQRLSDSVRPDDLVVRFGGDEFLVAVKGVRRRRDLQRLARRITRGVKLPIVLQGHELVISSSIGIALRNARTANIETLIAEADRAMYRAKSLSRDARLSLLKPLARNTSVDTPSSPTIGL